VLAIVVGLVMGGIQSLSRSTYSKLIPQDITDSASFFSFYDVTEKLAIVGGMFSFGLVDDITNSMRNSALVLCVYFIVGLVLLLSLLAHGKKQNISASKL
jgi:UMF1 family MFS transporter